MKEMAICLVYFALGAAFALSAEKFVKSVNQIIENKKEEMRNANK